MEEAKKNMYAFSTTTYTGFQCTVDEETSEKFKGRLQCQALLLLNYLGFFICIFILIHLQVQRCRIAWGSLGIARLIHRRQK